MPHKTKVGAEKKVQVAQQYLRGEISKSEAARDVHVSEETVDGWIRRYRSEGVGGVEIMERNRVYSPELKEAAVKEYLGGGGSLREICERYRIRSSHQLRQWIKAYNTHGDFDSVKHSGGGSYMKQGRNTTQEERIQIAKESISSGKNYGEIALEYNVSYQQARTWTLRFEELGEAGLEDRRGRRKKDQTPRTELEQAQIEIEHLKHENYLLTMERDLLKKLDEIERSDVSHK